MSNVSDNQTARWGKVHAWWLLHPMINADRFCILSALASYADERGLCHPSQATLARHLKRSRPWVNRVVRELTEIGLVRKTARTRSGNAGTTSCEYRLVERHDAAGTGDYPVTVVTPPDRDVDSPCHAGDTTQSITKQNRHPRSAVVGGHADDCAMEARRTTSQVDLGTVPVDWVPSDTAMAKAGTFCPGTDLEAHAMMFASRSRSKGYRYAHGGLDDAWLAWLAEDRLKHGLDGGGRRSAERSGSARDGSRDVGERRFAAWANAAAAPRVGMARPERPARDNPWKAGNGEPAHGC